MLHTARMRLRTPDGSQDAPSEEFQVETQSWDEALAEIKSRVPDTHILLYILRND